MKLFTKIGIYSVYYNNGRFEVFDNQERLIRRVNSMFEVMTAINADQKWQMKKAFAC